MRARVVVNLPFGQVRPFLARLFQSDRVPFRLENLSMERPLETIVFKDVVVADSGDGKVAGVDEILPEPPVKLTVELGALNWIGAPAAAPAETPVASER